MSSTRMPQLRCKMSYGLMSTAMIISIFQLVLPIQAVVMPPRLVGLQRRNDGLLTGSMDTEQEVPYILSITNGQSISVGVHSQSSVVINLNRAVPHDVNVDITIYSGSDLITLMTPPSTRGNQNLTLQKPSARITFSKNVFGDIQINFSTSEKAGHAEIVCKVVDNNPSDTLYIDDSSAYISVDVGKSYTVEIIIYIVGWIYFAAWSLSFYFQVILNYRRKSVVGLNFDFLALNTIGFTCYTIYNFTLMFSYPVQKEYYARHAYSRIPVEYNDLFFSLHASIITLVTVVQCLIYERAQQRVSIAALIFISTCSAFGLSLYIAQLFQAVTILNVVLYLSYVKLAVTVIKYAPQAWMNYKRKATSGWSIHNILLDFTGGLLSITQMFLLAYNYDDWLSIFGNFTKFGLGVISILFDIVFVIQHYYLYVEQEELEESSDSVPGPVISRSVMSTNLSTPSVDEDGQTSEENYQDD